MKKITVAAFTAALLLTGCNNTSNNSYMKDSAGSVSRESVNGTVTEYPEDNIFGLQSVREDDEGSSKIIAFTFKHLKKAAVNSSILSESDSISGISPYGSFTFDNIEIVDKRKYFEVVLTYDSRITCTGVSFNRGDERCNVNLNAGITLVYCDFSDDKLTKKTLQKYNTENMSWDESCNKEEERSTYEGAEPVIDTVKVIDYEGGTQTPVNTFGNLKFKASNYRYSHEVYNVYGEVTKPALTTLQFDLIDDKNPVVAEINESDIALYKKTGGKYTDITPDDVSLSFKLYNDDRSMMITVESSTLGDLEEGDYRCECGDYYVDFAIATHTYEVW